MHVSCSFKSYRTQISVVQQSSQVVPISRKLVPDMWTLQPLRNILWCYAFDMGINASVSYMVIVLALSLVEGNHRGSTPNTNVGCIYKWCSVYKLARVRWLWHAFKFHGFVSLLESTEFSHSRKRWLKTMVRGSTKNRWRNPFESRCESYVI